MACRLLKFKLSFKASRKCLRVAAACERIWWYAPAAYFALCTIYFGDKQTQAVFRFVKVRHLPVPLGWYADRCHAQGGKFDLLACWRRRGRWSRCRVAGRADSGD